MLLEEHMFGPLEQAAEKQPTNQPIFLNVYSILNCLPKKTHYFYNKRKSYMSLRIT